MKHHVPLVVLAPSTYFCSSFTSIVLFIVPFRATGSPCMEQVHITETLSSRQQSIPPNFTHPSGSLATILQSWFYEDFVPSNHPYSAHPVCLYNHIINLEQWYPQYKPKVPSMNNHFLALIISSDVSDGTQSPIPRSAQYTSSCSSARSRGVYTEPLYTIICVLFITCPSYIQCFLVLSGTCFYFYSLTA